MRIFVARQVDLVSTREASDRGLHKLELGLIDHFDVQRLRKQLSFDSYILELYLIHFLNFDF